MHCIAPGDAMRIAGSLVLQHGATRVPVCLSPDCRTRLVVHGRRCCYALACPGPKGVAACPEYVRYVTARIAQQYVSQLPLCQAHVSSGLGPRDRGESYVDNPIDNTAGPRRQLRWQVDTWA